MTESSHEQFQTSPELGFAFGRVPFQTVLDCLTSPELRDDPEAYAMAHDMETVRQYFQEGGALNYWGSYVGATKEARIALENQALPKEVHEKYQQIRDIILAEHIRDINEEKSAINDLLHRYPGLITQDSEGKIKLISVDSLSNISGAEEVTLQKQPIQQIARWSDESQAEILEQMPLYIDMTVLPESFSRRLNQYRVLYDITLAD